VSLRLVLNLRDRQQLAEVLRRLRRSPPVIRVSRLKH
jgi:(p)ppGpp synthase/HD superfamily hydrolase